jgi:dephospho-CoA kinase
MEIGLTGNRYSGKKTVINYFKKLDIPVFDADLITKFIINHDLEVDKKIKIELGTSLFDSYGKIDSSKLNTSEKFDRLIDIIDPILFKTYDRFKKLHPKSIFTIFYSSILFERNWIDKMDYSITVFAPKTTRMERCSESTKMSFGEIYRLSQSEIEDIAKNNRADYVIHSYDNWLSDVDLQVKNITNQLTKKFIKENLAV